jgi:outer membrane autotransporter protein
MNRHPDSVAHSWLRLIGPPRRGRTFLPARRFFQWCRNVLLFALASAVAGSALAAGSFAGGGCTGCHTIGGARVNAANASAVLFSADTRHGMGVGAYLSGGVPAGQNATDIASEITSANGVSFTQSLPAVAYHATVGFTVDNIVLDDGGAGVVLRIDQVAAPGKGSMLGSGTASVSYQHTASDCVADSFTVRGAGFANTATRTINVPTISPPLAAQVTSTLANTTVAYNPVAGVIVPGGPVFAGFANGIGTLVQPATGTVSVVGTTIKYTANPNTFASPVTFQYQTTGPCGSTSAGLTSVQLTVTPPAAPAITSGDIPGTGGQALPAYSIAATNFPFAYSSSPLPAGLSLNGATGAITGTPSVSGTFPITISAQNVTATTNKNVNVVIGLATPVITVPVSVPATSGSAFNYQIVASNLASTYAITLPAGLTGLSVDATTGLITGTPVVAAAGTYGVTLNAGNTAGTGVATLNINVALNPPVISSLLTASGIAGNAFSYQITASDFPTGFSAAPLPPGLGVNASGLVSGIPAGPASVTNVTIGASNGAGAGPTKVLVLTITLVAPVITSAATASAAVVQPFTYQITANNAPASFNATGLPAGLVVNTVTGLVSGTPTTSGTYNVTLSATNTAGTGNQALTITVGAIPLPTAAAVSASVLHDTATTIDLAAAIANATVIQVVSPPAHGTATVSNLGVRYTPSPGYFGPDSFTYRSVGLAEFSAPATVSITVGNPGPPAAGGGNVAVAFNTPTVLDLSATITGVATSVTVTTAPLHGTATTSGRIVTYTPTRGYSGPDIFTYLATGPGGSSAAATVTITVGTLPPVAGAATMTVVINAPTTFDLAPFIAGSGVTGIVVVAPPMHGSVAVSGTRITFTPSRNYFGSDAFTYSAFGNAGTSPAGVVNVVITGRPDPSADPAVTGLLTAQADTAQRFARTQTSNLQRRMESQHSRADNVPPGPEASVPPPRAARGLTEPAGNPEPAPRPDRAPGTSDGKLTALAGKFAAMLAGRSIDFGSVNVDGASADAAGGKAPGYWIYGIGNFGTRDARGGQSGLEFTTSGVSAGVDRRFGDDGLLGLALGYGKDKTSVGEDGTQSKAQGYAISAYGSWQPSPRTYLDALVGYGSLDFDTQRYVEPMNDYTRGSRSGNQFFASVAAGYEHRSDAALISPYARLDYASTRLNSSTESGAGQYALTYSRQTTPFFQGSLGLRAESVHQADFGWAAPRLRAEYQHVFKGERNASIGYADLLGGPQYAVTTSPTSGNAFMLGVGADLVRRDGWSFGFDYQAQYSNSDYISHTVRVAVARELDGRGWPFVNGSWLPVAKPLELQVDTGYQYDDNVNRANVASEKLSDSIYSVTANKAFTYPLGETTRGLLNISAGVLGFKTYEGLNQAYLGVQGDLQYRSSGEFDAPTFALFGRAFADEYRSDLRDGQRYSVGVSVRQALTDRIGVFGAVAYNVRNARSEVWDNRESAARLSFDYSLTPSSTLYLVGEYRRGSIVSSTNRPSLEQLDIANVFVRDNAFPGTYFAYQFDGRTVVSTLGWNIGFGPRDSLDLTWIRAQSTPDSRPPFGTAPPDYIVNQYSIIYLMRF